MRYAQKTYRAVINEAAFRHLVRGEKISLGSVIYHDVIVKVALSDISFDQMLTAIRDAVIAVSEDRP